MQILSTQLENYTHISVYMQPLKGMLVLFVVCTYSLFAVSVSRSPLGQRSRWRQLLMSAKNHGRFSFLSGLVRRPALLRFFFVRIYTVVAAIGRAIRRKGAVLRTYYAHAVIVQ